MHDPMQQMNNILLEVDSRWQRQRAIDRANLELLREKAQHSQDWGQTLPAWRIVEGSIVKETSADENA